MSCNAGTSLPIVGDSPENLGVFSALPPPDPQARPTLSGEKAPRAGPAARDIPVIFIAALDQPAAEPRGLEQEVARRLAENEPVEEVGIRALAHLAEAIAHTHMNTFPATPD